MTANEAELLSGLRDFNAAGCKPLDLGGSGHSNHSVKLFRLCAKGWAERNFGLGWGEGRGTTMQRGSCVYRITDAGRQALANHHALRGMA